MAAPVPLRSDFDAEALRGLAKGPRNPAQTRRPLALSVIAAGGARSEAAEIGGVGLQMVRDWVVAFNADGPDGLIDGKADRVGEVCLNDLLRLVEFAGGRVLSYQGEIEL